MPRRASQYGWPESLSMGPGKALWVTNPVYNTGDYSIEQHLPEIASIADSGAIVVVDEFLGSHSDQRATSTWWP